MIRAKPLIHLTAAAVLAFGSAHASEYPAAKLDNGLGELPHYRDWKHVAELARFAGQGLDARVEARRVPGEKLDSGLGALPHYSEWKKHPELARLVVSPAGEVEQPPVALGAR